MSDNVAVLEGYTKQYIATGDSASNDVLIMVKPDTDLDSRFKAWDSDNQEWIVLNGWMYSFENVTEENP